MRWEKSAISFLTLLCALPTHPVVAGQDITVNTNVGNVGVCGNSTDAGGIAGTTQTGSTNCTNSQSNNTITIGPSGRVGGHIFGGAGGNSTDNRVILDGGYASLDIMGGQATGAGDASKNTIIINSGTVNRNLYGGLGSTGTTADNTIIINGGTIGSIGVIVGGNANRGTITGNNVIISGGTINTQVVAGGRATAAGTFTLSNNSVTINADSGTAPVFSANTILYGSHCLNSTTCTFTNNTLNLSTKIAVKSAENFQIYNFDLGNGVVAGDTLLSVTDTAKISGANIALKATGNTAFMKGNQITLINKVDTNYTGTQNGVEQDGAGFFGLYDFGLNAAANDALIATVNRSLLAGGRGSRHTYTLNNATAAGDFAGGYADGTTHTSAINNTLHITTGFTNTDTTLYGGFCKTATCTDTITGNTLQLDSIIHVKETKDFQYYYFVLNNTFANTATAMLTTEGVLALSPATTDVKLGVTPTSAPLTVGDKFVLVDQASGYTAKTVSTVWRNGAVDETYNFDVKLDGSNLTATLLGNTPSIAPPAASALGSHGAVTAAINNDFDFLAFEGIRSAADAAGLSLNGINSGDSDRIQGGAFATTKGGWLRSYSDSGKTKIGGTSLLAGLSANIPFQRGDLLLGVFGEGGWSRYDDTTNGIDGNGVITTFGGGLLLHYQREGAYAEVVGRIGQADNRYHNNAADYSTHSTYYGAHTGAGYIFALTPSLSLDVNSKYFWTHQTGSTPTIMGDKADFKAINSHRWRNGARLQVSTTAKISPYIGGYYEYEFANTARGVIAGMDIPAISRQGGSGIGEIGAVFNAANATKVDLGLNGTIGKREGVVASLKMRWGF